MGIGPEPFDDRPLHCDFLSDVELRGAVVCQQGDRSGQEDKSDAESPQKPSSHCDCLQGAPSLLASRDASDMWRGSPPAPSIRREASEENLLSGGGKNGSSVESASNSRSPPRLAGSTLSTAAAR